VSLVPVDVPKAVTRTLRPPSYTEDVTDEVIHAAALQYVRKIAGMRSPSRVNTEAFDQAVQRVADATAELLDSLVIRPAKAGPEAR
jgi:hypothetical protein